MFTGLQGQKIMYTTSFVGKVCRKNPGFDKGKTAGMFGLTLYDLASFIPTMLTNALPGAQRIRDMGT